MLIQPTAILSAAAGAFAVVFFTLAASARPIKECSARYYAAAKASQKLRCRANASNVFARPPPPITLGIGDVVSVTIFEAEPGGLFIPSEPGARPGNFVTLPDQMVDSNGNITVPYAGTIRAVGRTPPEVQQAITEASKGWTSLADAFPKGPGRPGVFGRRLPSTARGHGTGRLAEAPGRGSCRSTAAVADNCVSHR